MGRLEGLRVYPVKGFDGMDLEAASILPGGTLEYDREFALFDAAGEIYNAKQSERFHEVDTTFDPDRCALTIDPPRDDRRTFCLKTETDRAEQWFREFFGGDLDLRRNRELGFVDRREMGPSVVSTATLRAVAEWFEGMTVDNVRRRIRANVEVSGVPSFWEDRFVGEGAPTFVVGDIAFEGVTPCSRCIVPQRDPDTGEPLPAFRTRFIEKRRETFPEWADDTAFDHFYSLMIITRAHSNNGKRSLRIGDPVAVMD